MTACRQVQTQVLPCRTAPPSRSTLPQGMLAERQRSLANAPLILLLFRGHISGFFQKAQRTECAHYVNDLQDGIRVVPGLML